MAADAVIVSRKEEINILCLSENGSLCVPHTAECYYCQNMTDTHDLSPPVVSVAGEQAVVVDVGNPPKVRTCVATGYPSPPSALACDKARSAAAARAWQASTAPNANFHDYLPFVARRAGWRPHRPVFGVSEILTNRPLSGDLT